MRQDTEILLENEWFIVRHSGETPEIAYNSAVYFLGRSKDGPAMNLAADQVAWLKSGAIERFREIILRDLQHCNVNKSIYRGIIRSIVNYQRYKKFCFRQDVDDISIKQDAAQALTTFLAVEADILKKRSRQTIINCSYQELLGFADELEVCIVSYADIFQLHCPQSLS